MRQRAITQSGSHSDRIRDLAIEIDRLVRHRSYAREHVVSSMLLRFLPSGMRPWAGVEDLRRRLEAAGLDSRALDHLAANVATERAMAHARG